MKRISVVFLLFLIPIIAQSQTEKEILKEIDKNISNHEALYRHFHQNPELSFEEFKTKERLSKELEILGFEISRGIGGNGFVGILQNGDGPVIMLRTDMDALSQLETGNNRHIFYDQVFGRTHFPYHLACT